MGQVFQFIRRPLDVFDPAMLTILGEATTRRLLLLVTKGSRQLAARLWRFAFLNWRRKASATPNACATPRLLPLAHGCRPAQSAASL